MRRVQVMDTTLRDGEQAPGICLGVAQKLAIARQLARLGVDVIEAGFPASSPGEAAAVASIARQVRSVTLRAMARCREADIEVARRCLMPAEHAQIGLFLPASALHLEQKLHMTPEQALSTLADMVYHARQLGLEVVFTAEDATRADREFLAKLLGTAVAAGATGLTVADTVGYATPAEYGALIGFLRERLDPIPIAAHCHNDLGLAVANTLAAVAAGAAGVEVTVAGIGERAGNAALEPVVMALQARPDCFGAGTGIDTLQLLPTAQLVARQAEVALPPYQPVVGANAFKHQSGIEQDGVLKDPRTYLVLRPEDLGTGSSIVLGKHSGRHAFDLYVAALGCPLSGAELEVAFTRFKDVCDQGHEVSDEELREIARGAATSRLKASDAPSGE